MNPRTKKICDSISPAYSMDVYREWIAEQPQKKFTEGCVEWYKANHEDLSTIYCGVAEAWSERGMNVKSLVEFCTDAYAIQMYHAVIDQIVAKEIIELTKSFPYNPR